MPRRNHQQSSPFIHRVFLPGLRSTLLALAVLAISFGSWLETNDSLDNCSIRDNLSIQKVTLLRNISSNSFSPDTVTFGLWKHCFIYALNCTCTPASLTYEPDTPTILEAAIGNRTVIPITDNEHSYWRVIPFALATAVGAIAFVLGIIANRLGNEKLQWCNAGLVLGTTILLVIGSGYTFHQYSLGIQNACEQLDHPYCTHIYYGAEFIVLVIGIALVGVSLLLWIYAPFSTKKQKREQENENDSTDEYYTMGVGTSQKLKKKEGNRSSSNNTMSTRPTSDVLEPWRDVALFDEKLRSDASYRPIQDDNYSLYDDYNNTNNNPSANMVNNGPLPPPPSNSNRYRQRQSIQDSYYDYSHHHHHQQQQQQQQQQHQHHHHHHHQQQQRQQYNRQSTGEERGEILQPPSRPFVSSPRRGSHGSGNTFGANNMLRNSRGSSIMMEDNDYYYSSGGDSDGNNSPIVQSSSRRRSSSAMSPYPSSNNHQRSQSPYSRPGTAPVGTNTTTHPLNHKVITDQRISAYLQQQQQQ